MRLFIGSPLFDRMINLEEEARKRRERLKSNLSGLKNSEKTVAENKNIESRKRKDDHERIVNIEEPDNFIVPEGETIYDSFGAEILGLDSKMPDTLEAQVKSLLEPQNDLIINPEINLSVDRNADLKREYERRMTKLNRLTKRSVVDIVRARLEQEKEANKEEEEESEDEHEHEHEDH